MTAAAATAPPRAATGWPVLALAAAASAGAALAGGAVLEAWHFAFLILAGFVTGSLGLLMIGHLMNEHWLAPVRSEAEAAALTVPLLAILALPLAVNLGLLYPWAADPGRLDLPPTRAAYLSPAFFLVRGAVYLAVWAALALWLTRARDPRRASAVGLALLAPTTTFAAGDWVLSREPLFWSSSFGFAYALSQLLAALAGAILISLLRAERPRPARMQSLERALLTLALLALWVWFAQFLIVWLADLPAEAAWYLARSGPWLWAVAAAAAALLLAVVILAPPGFGRRTMIAGSALLLVQHGAHMLWLVRPGARAATLVLVDAAVLTALGGLWTAVFAAALRQRPTFADEGGDQGG